MRYRLSRKKTIDVNNTEENVEKENSDMDSLENSVHTGIFNKLIYQPDNVTNADWDLLEEIRYEEIQSLDAGAISSFLEKWS